jgi:hypothetical protein
MENQIAMMIFGVGSILVFLIAICIIYFSRIKKGLVVLSEVKDKIIARR